jgi:hypothetical protein
VREVEFHRFLDGDNTLRVRFELERGRILKFTVQLESRFGESEEWIPVVRYDTAHSFAHCARLHPYEETVKTTLATNDYNEALNFAINDLGNNWAEYRRRYEEWLKRK